jgi:centrosomal protein CEP104
MIVLCRECKQAVEVRNLNTHLLSECAQHKYFKRCPKCKEAVPTR